MATGVLGRKSYASKCPAVILLVSPKCSTMPQTKRNKQSKASNSLTVFRSIKSQSATTRQLLTGYLGIVTAGNINGTVVPNSYVSSCTNWAAYATDYNNFRVLGARYNYMPHYGRSSAFGSGHGVAAVYNGSAASATPGAPSSFPDITSVHDDYRFFFAGKPFQLEWKPVFANQKLFCATATPATIAPFGGFVLRLQGLSAGTVEIAYLHIQFVVEFSRS